MEFEEVSNYGPSWVKPISDLIAVENTVKALALAKDAFVSCIKSKDASGKVFALHALARVHLSKFELGDASELAERALAELVKAPDERMHGIVMHTLAKISSQRFLFQDAFEFAQEAIRIFQSVGSKVGEAAVLSTMAKTNLRRGRTQDALKVAKQALAMFRDCEERTGEADALQTLARAYSRMKRHQMALQVANDMLALYEGDVGFSQRGEALLLMAEAQAAMDEHEDAVESATKAVDFFDGVDARRQAEATRRLADFCFNKGDDTDGWMYAKEALELYRAAGHTKGEAGMLCKIALSHFTSGNTAEAFALSSEGVRMCKEMGFRQQLANILEGVARSGLDLDAGGAAKEQQLNWKARQAAKEALAVYEEIGDVMGQMKAHQTLAMAFMSYGNYLEGRAKAKHAVELAQFMGDKAEEGNSLLLVAQSRFHDNRDEASRLASLAQRLIKDAGDKVAIKATEDVVEAIQGAPAKKKKEKKGGPSLAQTMDNRLDLTMDMDGMMTRAAHFSGFASRLARG